MARPLKYREGKTSVRNITIPDSMWEALPSPKSQWVVEAVRQFQEIMKPEPSIAERIDEMIAAVPEPIRSEVPDPTCEHPLKRQVNIMGGRKCLDCGAYKLTNGAWNR